MRFFPLSNASYLLFMWRNFEKKICISVGTVKKSIITGKEEGNSLGSLSVLVYCLSRCLELLGKQNDQSSLAVWCCSYKLRKGSCKERSCSPILPTRFHPEEILLLLSLRCGDLGKGRGTLLLWPSGPSRSEWRTLGGEEKGLERQNVSPRGCGADVEWNPGKDRDRYEAPEPILQQREAGRASVSCCRTKVSNHLRWVGNNSDYQTPRLMSGWEWRVLNEKWRWLKPRT